MDAFSRLACQSELELAIGGRLAGEWQGQGSLFLACEVIDFWILASFSHPGIWNTFGGSSELRRLKPSKTDIGGKIDLNRRNKTPQTIEGVLAGLGATGGGVASGAAAASE